MDSQQGRGRDLFDAAMGMPEPEDDRNLANSPVMHVALSARLGLDPAELAQYRSDMFPSGVHLGTTCLLTAEHCCVVLRSLLRYRQHSRCCLHLQETKPHGFKAS